jgi:hypothetical protein
MNNYLDHLQARSLAIAQRQYDNMLPPDDDADEWEAARKLAREQAAEDRADEMREERNQ